MGEAEFETAGEILYSKIHKQINFICNTEKFPDQWKESIIIQIHNKGDKTDCSNYQGISLLSTPYKCLSNILLSRLSPYVDEIIVDHQCGFRRSRSTTDQMFCNRQILEKKWEYNEAVHQLIVGEWGRRGMLMRYWWESQKERDHWEDEDVSGWTILK
jgi:hypothetical protein